MGIELTNRALTVLGARLNLRLYLQLTSSSSVCCQKTANFYVNVDDTFLIMFGYGDGRTPACDEEHQNLQTNFAIGKCEGVN